MSFYAAPPDARVVVLANRAPFSHFRDGDGAIVVKRSASGLVTALEPLVQAYGGTWVAHGAGDADAVVAGSRGRLAVMTAERRYRLRYVWLDADEHRGYYYGFANEGLWPLCHAVDVPSIFRPDDYRLYQHVNARFADAVAEEAAGGFPIVLVQDYHFALAPRLVRAQLRTGSVAAFWHIPWPRPRVFRTCPWARELLEGLLGADIVGLQTREDCWNFVACAESLLDARVDAAHGTVQYQERRTIVRAYPVGVESPNPVAASTPPPEKCRQRVVADLRLPPDVRLVVGIDRLDYTKGINEKFLAVEHLLATRAELRGRFVLVQVAEPSRDCLPAYRSARAAMLDTSRRVNARFGTDTYRPIHLLETHHDAADVYRLYRAADVCYVGSLHDGMNLVAKEFVSARDDERGVLVLSQFAGAAYQLRAAVLVNPHAVEASAEALAQALDMSAPEQSRRMRLLRADVSTFDASWWARELVEDALRVRRHQQVQRRSA
jgi:trehalose 6-phosphate synthase